MVVFVDTSAFYAMLDDSDPNCGAATSFLSGLVSDGTPLYTSNYVVVETCSLLQNRFGIAAVRRYQESFAPVVTVRWVDEQVHEEAVQAVLAANRRNLSIVDCTSFALMRRLGIKDAFAFDPHFAEQGFRVLPAPASA